MPSTKISKNSSVQPQRCLLGKKVFRARKREFPFIVSLSRRRPIQKKGNHMCGGALITKKQILTAAHCLADKCPDDIVVIAGNTNIECGEVYNVKSWITYNQWAKAKKLKQKHCENDIAIITLLKNVENIKPAIISPLKRNQVIGKNVVTAGWGVLNETGKILPDSMRKAYMKVLSLKQYKKIIKCDNICIAKAPPNCYITMAKPFTVLGRGDSGSPLLLAKNKQIVGVNCSKCKFDEEKHVNAGSFHVIVDYYRKFIKDVTKNQCSKK